MKYLKVLLTICFVDKVFLQWYKRVVYPPFFNIYCKETLVSSVINCLAVGRASKDVRLIYNVKNNYCRSQCTFLFNGTTSLGDEWHHYGMYYLYISMIFNGLILYFDIYSMINVNKQAVHYK